MGAIAEHLRAVRRRVADAADVAGRDPDEIRIVAVTKTIGVAEVDQAIAAGCHDFGENRVQEFVGKHGLFPAERWHMIGTLQSNKVRDEGVVQPILLQVNVAAEAQKHGFRPDDVEDALAAAVELRGVDVRGLMTMAPLVARPGDVRWVFRETRELLEQLREQHDLTELSMGMTNDFEVAIEEGATIVRVGRAIFGR
jgi:uncharacterized pyridoxal phosphate-containing UPF0001 family protein